ncbi:MAG: DUF11 domain-containing protein [Gammaproteobacteria bacterium]|nr:DUF11 domain-containing protein [Gammaproteobacteria bacterium]
MHVTRNLITLSASLLFVSAMLPTQAAPLPAGTVLTIDPGVSNATSPICYTGSCWRINIPTLPGHVYDYNFVPGTDGGIVIGKNQAAGVTPAAGELAGFVSVQNPTEAPGSMYTTPYTFDPTDASANIFDDQSCTSATACAGKTVLGTWNRIGGTGLMINMGSAAKACTSTYYCPGVTKWTLTAAGAPGLDGDRYVLEYQRTNPDNLDGYDQVYTFHLEGTIQLPKVAGVDVAATLSAAPDPVAPNTALTYTATVTSAGTQTATGVVLTDALPLGATFVSALASQGYCSGTAVVACALGDLASGASATVTIVVTPAAIGLLSNSVSVASSEADVNPVNNVANSGVVVAVPVLTADVGAAVSGSPNPVKLLSNVTYTIKVNNSGPDTADTVMTTIGVPFGMRFVSASISQGYYCYGTSTVVCLLGPLTSGANATVTVVMQARLRGTFTSVAKVSTTTKDSNTGNNSASIKITAK